MLPVQVEAAAAGPGPSDRRENADLLLSTWQKPSGWPQAPGPENYHDFRVKLGCPEEAARELL